MEYEEEQDMEDEDDEQKFPTMLDKEREQRGAMTQRPERRKSYAKCPIFCGIFDCVVGIDRCNRECENLGDSMICVLCKSDNDCDAERKKALLGLKYYNERKEAKKKDILKGINEVKDDYNYLERKLLDLKDDMLKASPLSIMSRAKIQSKGNMVIHDIKLYRQIFDKLGIKYEKRSEQINKKKGN